MDPSSLNFQIVFLGGLLNTVISIQPESGWFQIILPQGNRNPRPKKLTTDVVLA